MYVGLVKTNVKNLGKAHNVSNTKALCWERFHTAATVE